MREEERVRDVIDLLLGEHVDDLGTDLDGLSDCGLFVRPVLAHRRIIDPLDREGVDDNALGPAQTLDHCLDDDEARREGKFVVGELFLHENDVRVFTQILDGVHEVHDAIEGVLDDDLVAVEDVSAIEDRGLPSTM